VRISDAIACIAPEDVPTVVKKLAERFAVETEAAVRAKIFWVFAELGEIIPDIVEKAKIVNETAELLRNEESHRVKSQGLATLLKLGDYHKYIYFIDYYIHIYIYIYIYIILSIFLVFKNRFLSTYLC
jgi:integrator complex subunit 4